MEFDKKLLALNTQEKNKMLIKNVQFNIKSLKKWSLFFSRVFKFWNRLPSSIVQAPCRFYCTCTLSSLFVSSILRGNFQYAIGILDRQLCRKLQTQDFKKNLQLLTEHSSLHTCTTYTFTGKCIVQSKFLGSTHQYEISAVIQLI